MHLSCTITFFFFNDTATTEIYTLSLHDALPISLNADDESLYRPPSPEGRRHLGLRGAPVVAATQRSEEHTSELQSQSNLVCRLLLEKKKKAHPPHTMPRANDHLTPADLPHQSTP